MRLFTRSRRVGDCRRAYKKEKGKSYELDRNNQIPILTRLAKRCCRKAEDHHIWKSEGYMFCISYLQLRNAKVPEALNFSENNTTFAGSKNDFIQLLQIIVNHDDLQKLTHISVTFTA